MRAKSKNTAAKKKTTAKTKTTAKKTAKKTTAKAKTTKPVTAKAKAPAKKATAKTPKTVTKKSSSKSSSRKVKADFAVGDHVLYPMHGVGTIISMKTQTVLKKRQEYYIIELRQSKMTVMIPVAKAKEVGLRQVIDKKEVRKVLNLLKMDVVDTEEDWKIRYQNNMNKIKSGSIYEVSEVCRNLYRRAKDKELSIMERKLYETAYNLVTTEIATSKGMEIEDAGNLISEVLST